MAMLGPQGRRRWLALVVLAVAAALVEATGTAGVFLVIALLTAPLADGLLLEEIPLVGELTAGFTPSTLLIGSACALAVVYALKSVFMLFEVYARADCVNDTAAEVSARLYRGYLHAPRTFHLARNTAELARNCIVAVESVCRDVLGSGATLVSECMVVMAVLGVLLASVPGIAPAVAALVVIALGGVLLLTQARHRAWGKRAHELSRRQLQDLYQGLAAVREGRVLSHRGWFGSRFAQARVANAKVRTRREALAAAPRLAVETGFVWSVAALLIVVEVRQLGRAELVSTIGFFAYAGFRLAPSVYSIVRQISNIRFGSAALDALYEDWLEFVVAASPDDDTAAAPEFAWSHALELENVSYTYPDADRPAVAGLNLRIDHGAQLGIVGQTGAGKSTLVDLVVGVLKPQEGRIVADGRDIQAALSSWHSQLGYVPQTIYLTNDTLRRNIALGLPDDAIRGAALQYAVELAQLDDVVARLPAGLDTLVGERGATLSGGEQQRVVLARALYGSPGLLILDEPTAHLDGAVEAGLAAALAGLKGKCTTLIVSHRLAFLEHCDRVMLIDRGEILDVGSFEEVVARHPELGRGPSGGS